MIHRISPRALRNLYMTSFKQPPHGCHICDNIVKNSNLPWIDEDLYRRCRIRPCILQSSCEHEKGSVISMKQEEDDDDNDYPEMVSGMYNT